MTDPNFNMSSQAWDSTFGGGQGQMLPLDDSDPMNADSDDSYNYEEVQPWQSSHVINAFNGGFHSNLSWNRYLRIDSDPILDSTSFSHNLGKPWVALEPCDCVALHRRVLGHSTTGHTEDLHSVATDLPPPVPHSFRVTPDPAPAFSTTTTSTLFVPGHTVVQPGQQTFSAFPTASYPYVQSEHPATSTPIHSTIPTSALVSNHAAACPMTHAEQHQPPTTVVLPPPVTFPTGSTSAVFVQSQTVGHYPIPLLPIPSDPPTSSTNSHFLDCHEVFFLTFQSLTTILR